MLDVLQSEEYEKWYGELRDLQGKVAVSRRADRIAAAGRHIGDCKPVGGGVTESRIMGKGPGYRLYSAIRGEKVLLLLVGGDKSSQQRDIELARSLLAEYDAQFEQVPEEGRLESEVE